MVIPPVDDVGGNTGMLLVLNNDQCDCKCVAMVVVTDVCKKLVTSGNKILCSRSAKTCKVRFKWFTLLKTVTLHV